MGMEPEYTIPRMGRRVDVVIIRKGQIFLLEFKVFEDEVHELLKDERCANFIKACVMSTWHKAKDKYGQPAQDVTDKE